MARGAIYTGIDVGTCKVTTVVVSQDAETRKLSVVGVATEASKGIKKSQVVDIEATVEAITKSVEAAERMAGFSISDAFVSIGGQHISSQNSKGVVAVSNSGEEISESDVERVVEAARAISLPNAREILHVIPRDFSVDSQGGIKDPLSMSGVRLEVDAHIITGSSTSMRNLARCVTEIGINVNGLVFSGLAAAESVLTDTERELGVCLIDIGGGSSSVAVFIEGALTHSFVVPVGAKHITNDLAIGLRVSLEESEKIKLALSNHKKENLLTKEEHNSDSVDVNKLGVNEELKKPSYKFMVEGIIRPRLNEIFEMIEAELRKHDLLNTTPAGVVLCGGGSLTIGIAESCKRVLSMPVRVAKLDGSQQTSQRLTGLIDDIQTPEYAVVQGLVLYSLSQARVENNNRMQMPQLKSFMDKFSGKGAVSKAVNFVKSFLP